MWVKTQLARAAQKSPLKLRHGGERASRQRSRREKKIKRILFIFSCIWCLHLFLGGSDDSFYFMVTREKKTDSLPEEKLTHTVVIPTFAFCAGIFTRCWLIQICCFVQLLICAWTYWRQTGFWWKLFVTVFIFFSSLFSRKEFFAFCFDCWCCWRCSKFLMWLWSVSTLYPFYYCFYFSFLPFFLNKNF